MSIRPGKKEDNIYVPKLILNAIGDIAKVFTGYEKEDDIIDTIGKFYQIDECRFSYKNTIVYEKDKKVVGVILGYYSKDVDNLDIPIINHLRKKGIKRDTFDEEFFENEYYIDTVSVNPNYQGRGIAKKLIRAMEDKAKKLEHHTISLIVDINKENAYRLYEKLGYKEDRKIEVYGHPYRHMLKKV
ncbi:acetyltransferase [Gottschalkia purinilytica]|uniref:Acetyltransferase n=1 Tax=Gottschalkia purinilytica TaxID=1503 RepID=A0A0L0WBS9_GOTPU|nr:GNAT family N-acetyltransferase [Gottschalkia purinilytica]KNF08941.1 acetyltransferase [Gottschalkia purinilytica]